MDAVQLELLDALWIVTASLVAAAAAGWAGHWLARWRSTRHHREEDGRASVFDRIGRR